MSQINKSKTMMTEPKLTLNNDEPLIKIKYISKENLKQAESHQEYEKLRHNLKKRLREKMIDEFVLKVTEKESKDINNQNKNEQNKLGLLNNNINTQYKKDRNIIIKVNYFRYQNIKYSNTVSKMTDMTTKIKNYMNKKLYIKPKYKYNYSSNGSNVTYNKNDFGKNDNNKGNIYIGKKSGYSYNKGNKYNNFGSLTIIQHNIENSKKYKNLSNVPINIKYNSIMPKSTRNNFNSNNDSQRTFRSSRSSWTIFLNSANGKKARDIEEIKDLN